MVPGGMTTCVLVCLVLIVMNLTPSGRLADDTIQVFRLPEVHLCSASCFSPCDAAELSDLMQSWAGFGFCF